MSEHRARVLNPRSVETEFLPIIRRIARALSRRVPAHMLEREELEALGMKGLLGAIKTYNPRLGVPFRPYGIRRIYGEMVDAVRKLDPVPHPTLAVMRNVERVSIDLAQRLGRLATEAEVAEALNMTPAELAALRARVASMRQPRHIDERVAGDDYDPLTLGDTIHGDGDPLDKLTTDEDARGLVRRLLIQLTPLELQVALFFHVDKAEAWWIAQRLGMPLMETLAIVGDVGLKVGARNENGELLAITPKRRTPA